MPHFLPHFPVSTKQSKRFETKNLKKIISPNYPNPSEHSMPCGIELQILTGSCDHGELVGHCLAANLVHPSGGAFQKSGCELCRESLKYHWMPSYFVESPRKIRISHEKGMFALQVSNVRDHFWKMRDRSAWQIQMDSQGIRPEVEKKSSPDSDVSSGKWSMFFFEPA